VSDAKYSQIHLIVGNFKEKFPECSAFPARLPELPYSARLPRTAETVQDFAPFADRPTDGYFVKPDRIPNLGTLSNAGEYPNCNTLSFECITKPVTPTKLRCHGIVVSAKAGIVASWDIISHYPKAEVGHNNETPHDWNCETLRGLSHNSKARVSHNFAIGLALGLLQIRTNISYGVVTKWLGFLNALGKNLPTQYDNSPGLYRHGGKNEDI
jgi:hypothetical protein